MFTQGVHGSQLPTTPIDTSLTSISAAKLEVLGIDWEALQNDTLLQSRDQDNESHEGAWLGHTGPSI